MQKVGSRELKNRFGKYLRAVRNGQSLLITVRKQAVAKISPTNDKEEDSLKNTLERLEEEGYLRLGRKPLVKIRRVPSRGKSASQMIIEDRR